MMFPLNVNVIIILPYDNLFKKPYACLPQFTSICISSVEAMLADWKSQSMILCLLVSSRMQKSIVFKKKILCVTKKQTLSMAIVYKQKIGKLHLNFLRDKSFILYIVTGDNFSFPQHPRSDM